MSAGRVFIVGNNDYPRSPLAGGIADAMSWKEFAKATDAVVSVATNARRKTIETGLAWVAEQGGVFYYAGHGTLNYRNGILCEAVCPIDMDVNGSIADFEIAKLLTPRDKPVICILDCCHGNNEFYGRKAASPLHGPEFDKSNSAHALPSPQRETCFSGEGDGNNDRPRLTSRYIETERIDPADLGSMVTTKDVMNLRPRLTSRYIETERIDTTDMENRAAVGCDAGLWARTNVALLNACKSNQSSYEGKINGIQRGYFTTSLQAVYKPEYSLREWLNRAGRYIRTQYDCDIQTPRAVGNEAILKGSLK